MNMGYVQVVEYNWNTGDLMLYTDAQSWKKLSFWCKIDEKVCQLNVQLNLTLHC